MIVGCRKIKVHNLMKQCGFSALFSLLQLPINVKVVTSLLQGGLVAERLLQPVCQVVTTLHCGCHSVQLIIYNLVKINSYSNIAFWLLIL